MFLHHSPPGWHKRGLAGMRSCWLAGMSARQLPARLQLHTCTHMHAHTHSSHTEKYIL